MNGYVFDIDTPVRLSFNCNLKKSLKKSYFFGIYLLFKNNLSKARRMLNLLETKTIKYLVHFALHTDEIIRINTKNRSKYPLKN